MVIGLRLSEGIAERARCIMLTAAPKQYYRPVSITNVINIYISQPRELRRRSILEYLSCLQLARRYGVGRPGHLGGTNISDGGQRSAGRLETRMDTDHQREAG